VPPHSEHSILQTKVHDILYYYHDLSVPSGIL
jgi:hypothetical protein